MTDLEYAQADRELFAMVNGKTPTGGKTVGIIVPVNRVRELAKLERIQVLMPVVCAALVTEIFLAATVFGWMDMVFGSIVTLAAAARAVVLFWRYRHGRK